LTSAAVMDTKAGKFVKKWSGAQWLGNAGIRREAAIDRLEQYKKEKKREIMERGGGISGWLAPSYDKIAKQEAKANAAAAEAKEDYRDLQIKAELDLFGGDKAKFEEKQGKLLNEATAKNIAKLQKEADEETDPDEKEKKRKELEAVKRDVANADSIEAKVKILEKEAYEETDPDEKEKKLAEIANLKGERIETLAKASGLGEGDVVALEQKAMSGLSYMRHRTQVMKNADAENTMKETINETFSKMNLASLSRQRNELDKANEEALAEYIKGQMEGIDEFTQAEILQFAEDFRKNKISKRVSELAKEEKKDPEKLSEVDRNRLEEKAVKEIGSLDFSTAAGKFFEDKRQKKQTRINALVKEGNTLDKATAIATDEQEKEKNEKREVVIKELTKDGSSVEDAKAKIKQKVLKHYNSTLDFSKTKYRDDLAKKKKQEFEDKFVADEQERVRKDALAKIEDEDSKRSKSQRRTQSEKEELAQEDVQKHFYDKEGKLLDERKKEIEDYASAEMIKDDVKKEITAEVDVHFKPREEAIQKAQTENGDISEIVTADTKAALVDNMSDYERANVLESVVKDPKHKSWTKLRSFYATKSASRSANKYKGEEEKLTLRMSDVLRGLEGKTMDEERNYQRSKIADSMKEFQNLTYDERMAEMKRNVKEIKNLGAKEKLGTLTAQEKDVLKNASQRQAAVLSSIMDQGEFNAFANEFRHYMVEELGDESYAGLENNMQNTATLALGALTGMDRGVIDRDMSGVQEIFRKRLKEKEGVLMRTLQHGMEKSANNGNSHHYHQVVEGVNANGTKVVGFTKAMVSGVGTGSGNKGSLGTGENIDGSQKIMEDYLSTMAANFNLSTSTDGRSFMVTNSQGHAVDFQHERARESVLSIANLSSQAISSMGDVKLRYLAGSKGYGASIYDRTDGKLHMPSGRISQTWSKVLSDMTNSAQNGGSANIRDNALRSLRALYKSWGVPGADTMSIPALRSLASSSGFKM